MGTPQLCADRLAATHERTGISRFALLVEGTGDLAATERNVQRLGEEVLPQLPRRPDSATLRARSHAAGHGRVLPARGSDTLPLPEESSGSAAQLPQPLSSRAASATG